MNNILSTILQEDASILFESHGDLIKENSKILITGASGLIGINLLSFFLSPKFKEKDLNIYITIPSEKGLDFIKSIYPNEKIYFIKYSLEDFSINNIDLKFDYIFHLATYGQPNRFTSESEKTMQLNSIGTIKLFDALSKNGRFFFSSSSEVYSGNTNYPHQEHEVGTTNTIHPRACYIEGKRFGEAYCYLKSQQGFKTYTGRISLSYGPGFRKNDKRVLNEFIFNAIFNKEIKMLDDGSAIRVYCYVRDTIDMILRLIHTEYHQPINICGIEKTSILELGSIVSKECFSKLIIGPKNNSMSGAPQVVSGSVELIDQILMKKTFVNIEDGVSKSVKWALNL
jgi:UDP-glucuronate decarboxylase